ncbi:hypothetical protein QCM80_22140 [Bradyrhizobium sp. SSUT112]|nr:hypothetical protein [Bradyrhizobium sp. SSUT112]MDH2353338.1 hypothetical protein [Bradyrhizobium sp. SSUT112]
MTKSFNRAQGRAYREERLQLTGDMHALWAGSVDTKHWWDE